MTANFEIDGRVQVQVIAYGDMVIAKILSSLRSAGKVGVGYFVEQALEDLAAKCGTTALQILDDCSFTSAEGDLKFDIEQVKEHIKKRNLIHGFRKSDLEFDLKAFHGNPIVGVFVPSPDDAKKQIFMPITSSIERVIGLNETTQQWEPAGEAASEKTKSVIVLNLG